MRNGFTLVELILVVAMMAVVGAMTAPFLQTFQTRSDLVTTADSITHQLRRAQQNAAAGQNGNGWGVFFNPGNKTMTLYYGTSYASRDQSFDQIDSLPTAFTFSTDFSDDIYFNVFSGQASASGTVTITDQNNQTKKIVITGASIIKRQ